MIITKSNIWDKLNKNRDPIILTLIIHAFLFILLSQLEILFIPSSHDRRAHVLMSEEIFREEEELSKSGNQKKIFYVEEYSKTLKKTFTNEMANLDEFTENIKNQYKEIVDNSESLKEARQKENLFSDEAYERDYYGTEKMENDFYSDIEKTEVFTGKSNISYSLEGRIAIRIYNPIYTCPNSGLVVIDIEVDETGNVVSTKVSDKSKTEDKCLIEMAKEYSKRSIFNVDYSKKIQKGFIVFNFI